MNLPSGPTAQISSGPSTGLEGELFGLQNFEVDFANAGA